MKHLSETLSKIAREYPPELVAAQLSDVVRIAFHISLLGNAKSVCDIGGGIGLFSVGCAALGIKATLVDDFNDPVNKRFGGTALPIHAQYGVEVVKRDAVVDDLRLPPSSFDAITLFDSMEHFHHSPKHLLHSLLDSLVPHGLLIIGCPNCVNIRKRITVPLGYGEWSSMSNWY